MTLTHTQQSGYIRLDDVYTDDDGVEYTVYQDTDAEDPRSWLTHEEAALDHPDYDTLCGIYADDPESAVEEYIDDYRPTQRQLTLF